jgi:hypothetical protein
MAASAFTDTVLSGWLRFEVEHGSNFMRAIAEAAFTADTPSYAEGTPSAGASSFIAKFDSLDMPFPLYSKGILDFVLAS